MTDSSWFKVLSLAPSPPFRSGGLEDRTASRKAIIYQPDTPARASVTIKSYVRRLAVGKNKTGSNAVPSDAWTAVDAPGRIAASKNCVSDKLTLDYGGDRWQPQRIVSALVAGICATRLRPSIVTTEGFAERLVGEGNGIGCEPYRG